MKIYFDSSAYAKRFIEEPGSQKIDDICQQATEVGLSIICFPEIISALNRRLRERSLTKHDYVLARERLSDELSDIQIVNITPRVIAKSGVLLETNPLRAMDAMHIACAIEWSSDIFVTSDQQQAKAARKSKMTTNLVIE